MTTTTTGVPLLDLTRMDAALEGELSDAFQRVLRSGRYILGPEVDALEEECASYVQARHALGVSSGTDALVLALMALDIGPGDEVICPSYTFFATAGSIWRLGAKPVFCDSLPGSFNCDPRDIERRITSKTRAIIPVHLFGQCADMGAIQSFADRRGIAVVEDAAQAIGSEWSDGNGAARRAGSSGAFGCFSFFPSKNLGALGDAGLLTTNEDALAERARILRVHGGQPKYFHKLVGGNFRIDALQAALIRPRLTRLDAATAGRQENAHRYTERFLAAGIAAVAPTDAELIAGTPSMPSASNSEGPAITLPAPATSRHIYNQYVIRVHGEGRRDRLREFLNERRIGNEVYYPVPLHLQECFAGAGGKPGDLPIAELAAKESLAIPIFPELREDELEQVIDAIVEFAKG